MDLTYLSLYMGAHNSQLSRQRKKEKTKDGASAQMFYSLTAYFRTGNKGFLPIQIALFLWKLMYRHVERHAHKMG